MNKERILQVADMINVSDTFTMTCEAHNSSNSLCGTPGCVIGHANVARLNAEGVTAPYEYADLIPFADAATWLGITFDEAEQMFYPKYWAKLNAYKAADVAAGLRKFAETGDANELKYPVNKGTTFDDMDLD